MTEVDFREAQILALLDAREQGADADHLRAIASMKPEDFADDFAEAEAFCQEGENRGKPGPCPDDSVAAVTPGAAATTGAQARKKERRLAPDAPAAAAPRTSIGRRVWGAIKGVGSKLAGGTGRIEHAAKLRLAHALDSLEGTAALAGASVAGGVGAKVGAAAGRALAGFLRGSLNAYFSTYFLASEAVANVAREIGKSQGETDKVAGLFTAGDLAGAKGEIVAGEMAELSGLAITGVSMVPIASIAYLLYSARPKSKGGVGPVGVLKACAKAIAPVFDRIIHPNKYKITAQDREHAAHAERKSSAKPEQIKAVFDRLDQFDDPEAREWWWAMLHVAMDFAGQDVEQAMELADAAVEANPEPPEGDEEFAEGRQEFNFSCGAAVMLALCDHFEVGPQDEAECRRILGAGAEDGVPPDRLVTALRAVGIDAQPRDDMSLAELERHLILGRYVVCPVQWGGEGHWMICYGRDAQGLWCHDTSEGEGAGVSRKEWDGIWHDADGDGREYDHYGIVVGSDGSFESYCQEGRNKGKPGPCPKDEAEETPASGSAATPAEDPAANRPSRPEERHPDSAPKPLPWREPPPKVPRPKGEKFKRPKGDQSQTALGDQAEAVAVALGFRSILPPGRRSNRDVATEGSSIDLEFGMSGKAYELKMCSTHSTEFRLKAKAEEKEGKLRFAELHGLTPYTMIGVRDPERGEIHFYAGREPGLTGAEVSPDKFDYLGTVSLS